MILFAGFSAPTPSIFSKQTGKLRHFLKKLNEHPPENKSNYRSTRQVVRDSKVFRQSALRAAVVLWLLAIAFGMTVLGRYSVTPGKAASPPNIWPRGLPVEPRNNRAMLVVFAHPKCPCSRASIEELSKVMARTPGKLDAHVFFYAPPVEGREWVETSLWWSAASIPGVQVMRDLGGSLAARLGASTSGQALLYSAAGRLLFQGGITFSRGHSGDNKGSRAIVDLIHGGLQTAGVTPVFGCSLQGQ